MIAKYFIEFIVFSFAGWIWECFYCCIAEKHWSNRGFLYGPICPIYGVGVILCSIIFGHVNLTVTGETPLWAIFVICAFGSAILEYGTSYILEKVFHAVWWDYSHIPFNVHGRICLPIMLCFGGAGILVVKYVLPAATSVQLGTNSDFAEVVALFLMAILAADTALSIETLIDLTQKIDTIEAGINQKIEKTYEAITEMPKELQERYGNLSDRLTERQRYSLFTIKKYSSNKTSEVALRLKQYIDEKIHKDNSK